MSEEQNPQEFESVVPSEAVKEAQAAALAKIHERSFSGRHPEFGKMIKCQVCGLRHRQIVACKQKFVEKYVEEDVETSEITINRASR